MHLNRAASVMEATWLRRNYSYGQVGPRRRKATHQKSSDWRSWIAQRETHRRMLRHRACVGSLSRPSGQHISVLMTVVSKIATRESRNTSICQCLPGLNDALQALQYL